MAAPFRQAEFQILYGKGIYRNGEIIDLGVQQGLIEKAGAWYSHKGVRMGQGKANSARYLEENPEICQALEQEIRSQLLAPVAGSEKKPEVAVEAADAKK